MESYADWKESHLNIFFDESTLEEKNICKTNNIYNTGLKDNSHPAFLVEEGFPTINSSKGSLPQSPVIGCWIR